MRSGSIRRQLIAGAALAMLVTPGIIQTAAAAPPRERDWAALDAKVHQLMENGASQAAIDAMLAKQGIYRADDGEASGVVTQLSTNSNMVTLERPLVYWDDRYSRYYATATFAWSKSCGGTCAAIDCGLDGNCGGMEGFGIRVTRTMDVIKTTFYTYDNKKQFTWNNPETNNDAGASWKEPDNYSYLDGYSWQSGAVYWFFNKVNCPAGTSVKVWSRYEHVWNTTSITGFGVSTNGFNVTWNNGSDHWTATNASSGAFTC